MPIRLPTRLLVLSLLVLSLLLACRPPAAPPAAPPAGAPTPQAALPAACGVPASATVSRAGEAVADPVATFDTAWTIIRRSHWDTTYNGVDWLAVRDELRPQALRARTRGELQAVLSDMVGRLRQSHFSIIPQEVADGTSGGTSSARGGGSLGFETRLVDGVPVVSRVDTGGPAWTVGVRTGWVVEAVRGCPTAALLARLPAGIEPRRATLMAYQAVTGALAGAEGDTITVDFRDGRDQPRAVRLTHGAAPGSIAKVGNLPPLPAHLTWQRVRRDGRTVGVIRFNIWMPVLAAQFDAAMDSLRSADAIVLDVRGNVGGIGGMSMGFAGHFLDSAYAIGTMKQRGSTLNFIANPRRVDTRARAVTPFVGPLALVVDAVSVSTTEIFAGGLQGLRRATVFGTQTAGEALPSVPERLPNGDILYHAVADFIGPTGKPVEGDGVVPDRVTPLSRRALLDGHDAALEAALTWAARQSVRPLVP
jgi:carboxyl-terminal processing protease